MHAQQSAVLVHYWIVSSPRPYIMHISVNLIPLRYSPRNTERSNFHVSLISYRVGVPVDNATVGVWMSMRLELHMQPVF